MNEAKASIHREQKPLRRFRFWFAHILYKWGWCTRVPQNGIRKRIYSIMSDRHYWWDWGHRVMALVGQDFGGNWSEPSMGTWWYRYGPPKRQRYTGFPRHTLSTFEVIKDYDEFRKRTEGLNADQMYEWQAMNFNQDGDLHLGHRYWGNDFYALASWDIPLLQKYLRAWRRRDWYGLRTWIYQQALHNAVEAHNPFSCAVTPPKGTGGYSHWHCDLKRRHKGPHRFNNYIWDPDKPRVEYDPV